MSKLRYYTWYVIMPRRSHGGEIEDRRLGAGMMSAPRVCIGWQRGWDSERGESGRKR